MTHTYATENSDGKCTVCRFDHSQATEGHSWNNGTCTVCHLNCDHSSGHTADAAGKCNTCGKEVGHNWTNGACTICSFTCSHSSHTQSGICSVCGISGIVHVYDGNTHLCSCGKKDPSIHEHNWTNGICSVCNSKIEDSFTTSSGSKVIDAEVTAGLTDDQIEALQRKYVYTITNYTFDDDKDESAGDGFPADATKIKVIDNITYTRDSKETSAAHSMEGTYISVCLPFALTEEMLEEIGGVAKQVEECNGSVVRLKNFDYVTLGVTSNGAKAVPAGMPVIIKKVNSAEFNDDWNINISGMTEMVCEPIDMSPYGSTYLIGSFDTKSVSELGSGTFYKVSADGSAFQNAPSTNHLYPYRAILHTGSNNAPIRQLGIEDLNQLNDGIDYTIIDTDTTHPIYNLQGVMVGYELEKLPAGLYIINGIKIKK